MVRVTAFILVLLLIPFAPVRAQWTTNGSVVTPLPAFPPVAATDGNGGVFVAWQAGKQFEGDIYLKRMDAYGHALWPPIGIGICTAADTQNYPAIVSDGSGGVIVAWADRRSGDWDIYAQHVDGSGASLWTPNGIPVCTASSSQLNPILVSDGAGGAIAAWWDSRINWGVT